MSVILEKHRVAYGGVFEAGSDDEDRKKRTDGKIKAAMCGMGGRVLWC